MPVGTFFFEKEGGAQRAVARGALRVEAEGHVGGDGRTRGWADTWVVMAGLETVAGHRRVGKGSPQPSGAEGCNVRYAPCLPSAGCDVFRHTGLGGRWRGLECYWSAERDTWVVNSPR